MRVKIGEDYARGSEKAICSCGGYAEKSTDSPTKEEIEAYDCGRDFACCSAVFKCVDCDNEFIATFEVPEIEW